MITLDQYTTVRTLHQQGWTIKRLSRTGPRSQHDPASPQAVLLAESYQAAPPPCSPLF